MVRLGHHIRLTSRDVERFTEITGFVPENVKTLDLDTLSMDVLQCVVGERHFPSGGSGGFPWRFLRRCRAAKAAVTTHRGSAAPHPALGQRPAVP